MWDAWPVWLLLIGLALGWMVALPFSTSMSQTVRCAGMVLQIAGLLVVAFGLRKLRCMFNRPSTSQNTIRWFRRVASAFTAPKVITAQMSTRLGDATLKAEDRANETSNTESALDERVAIIEENLRKLRDELDAKIHAVRQELVGLRSKLA